MAGDLTDRIGAIRERLGRAGFDGRLAGAAVAPLIGALVTLWLVIPTLAPGMLSQAGGDTAEFQTVAWVLGTAHPTGYPAYMVLGFIATHVLPFGDPAFRLNLLQAFIAAGAVAGTIAVVRLLTGMRWIALATGLLLLAMPWFEPVQAGFPSDAILRSSPVFWRLSTYADPHMFHLALTTLIFLLLLIWERRRRDADPESTGRADRWLVAAAAVFGIALTNHSLTLMLAPGIGLFVLAVAPRILLQWRVVVAAGAALLGMAVLFWLELPIRAAMHAPLVYAHPDTLGGFLYVVTGQQFGGIPPSIAAGLGAKFGAVMSLMSSWLGPLGYIAALGLGSSLIKRPRYVLLTVSGAILTASFAAAYANSDLERYYLVPVFVAFTFVGLGLADIVSIGVWLVESATGRLAGRIATASAAAAEPDAGAVRPRPDLRRGGQALIAVEIAAAIVLVVASMSVVPTRTMARDTSHPAQVSLADETARVTWMRAVLAPADQGGVPRNSVIVSNWFDSTALWYGQIVEGLRPDVYVVDDSTRVAAGKNLGPVWNVIDSYLDQRPVFLLRAPWNCDGIISLARFYMLEDYPLRDGLTITQVMSKTGPVVCP